MQTSRRAIIALVLAVLATTSILVAPVIAAPNGGDSAIESTDPTTGTTDPTTGATDPTTGATDPTTGATDPTTGATDLTTGATDPTTGATVPTIGYFDPTTGTTDPTTGATDLTTGTADLTTGAVGESDRLSGESADPAKRDRTEVERIGRSPASDAFERGSADAAAADASEPTGSISDWAAVTDDTIHLRNSLRQVDTVGEFGVTTRVRIPDRVSELRLTIPADAANVRATGFSREDENVWAWDGSTEEPRLTYRMPANRTVEASGPLEGRGDYLFVDTGDWAIVRTPGIGASWRSIGQARLQRENRVEGDGVASRAIAFLGPHEEHVHEAHGQRFRLIVPTAADMAESPAAVLDSMEHASGALQVGDRDPEVFAVAAPTGDVGWGVRGLQTGPADMWVRDEEELATADNVWVHEYVHTRQGYATTSSARWFTEATATYYAALLTLERGDVTFSVFRDVLARGERDPQASSILAEPDTWRNNADYTKGGLVAGGIDRRIRLATDGEATLATVFRELNAQDGQVTNDDVLSHVRDAGGSDARESASRFTTTRDAPAAWDRAAHDEAFGQLPARVGYSLSADDAVRANGEYRDRPIARDPVRLVPGETLELDVRVVNTGGVSGEYDLGLVVDGEVVDARNGRIAADDELVESFAHEFTGTGEYQVSVGGTRLPVVVTEPATPTVSDFRVSADRVSAGESVTLELTLSNGNSIPAREVLELRRDGEVLSTETVRLDASQELTYRVDVVLPDPGEVTLSLGGESVSVTVASDGTATTSDRVPGFGASVAALALALTALLGRRRYRV